MKPPLELFLAAAIVVAVAIIPLIWGVKDSDRLRAELMRRKDAETAAAEEGEAVLPEETEDTAEQ